MPLKESARMVIMSTLMSVTVFMNFSKSRSDISRAVGVSAEAVAGDGAVAGAGAGLEMGLLLELRQHVQVSVVLFTDMDICSPFAGLVSCSFAGLVSCSFGSC